MLQVFSPEFSIGWYIAHIHGFFFYIHGSRVEPHPIDLFDWLSLEEMKNNMASKQVPLRLMKQLVWLQKRQIHRRLEHCDIKIVQTVDTFLVCMHPSFKSLIHTIW